MSIRNDAGTGPQRSQVSHLLSEWWQRQRSLRELETLDDAILRDIGLSRSELGLKASKPFWLN